MKLFWVILIVVIFGIFLSLNIPFIYSHIEFQVFILGYLFLYLLYIYFIVFQHKKNIMNQYKGYQFFQNMRPIKERFLFFTGTFLMPLGVGWLISLSTPIVAEIVASNFEIRQYRISELIQTSPKMGNKVRVFVTDIKNEQSSFIVNPEFAARINLHMDQQITVSGRRMIFGFVVDNINGVRR